MKPGAWKWPIVTMVCLPLVGVAAVPGLAALLRESVFSAGIEAVLTISIAGAAAMVIWGVAIGVKRRSAAPAAGEAGASGLLKGGLGGVALAMVGFVWCWVLFVGCFAIAAIVAPGRLESLGPQPSPPPESGSRPARTFELRTDGSQPNVPVRTAMPGKESTSMVDGSLEVVAAPRGGVSLDIPDVQASEFEATLVASFISGAGDVQFYFNRGEKGANRVLLFDDGRVGELGQVGADPFYRPETERIIMNQLAKLPAEEAGQPFVVKVKGAPYRSTGLMPMLSTSVAVSVNGHEAPPFDIPVRKGGFGLKVAADSASKDPVRVRIQSLTLTTPAPPASDSSPTASAAPAEQPYDVLLGNTADGKSTTVVKGSRLKLALVLDGLTPDSLVVDHRDVVSIEQPLRSGDGKQWTAYALAKDVGSATMSMRVSLDCQRTSCRGAGMVRAPFTFRIVVTDA